jgi:uncharacterized cupredoxin-like copper-binding protein
MILQRWILVILSGVIAWLWVITPVEAMDLAHQTPIVVEITLSNETGALKFFPPQLAFQAGKRYQLHLVNHSPEKHYFTAKDFADAIWSQKVDAGRVEIKGAIHELELRSDTTADWVFVPMRPGQYSLRCTIPGHTEAGMVGQLTIQ